MMQLDSDDNGTYKVYASTRHLQSLEMREYVEMFFVAIYIKGTAAIKAINIYLCMPFETRVNNNFNRKRRTIFNIL